MRPSSFALLSLSLLLLAACEPGASAPVSLEPEGFEVPAPDPEAGPLPAWQTDAERSEAKSDAFDTRGSHQDIYGFTAAPAGARAVAVDLADGGAGFVDARYYHDRRRDDAVPTLLSRTLDVPVYRPDLMTAGGNFTGHVDMFAKFTAEDTVLVGRYDPAVDPQNADILDWNAERLAGLTLADGRPLRVVRIPMPTGSGDVYRSSSTVSSVGGRGRGSC